LISRSLVKEGLLENPAVYMSAYINEHKQEYVDLLLGIIKRCGISKPTANNDLNRLEKLGIVEEYTGKERDRDWIAREIVGVIEQEAP